MAKKMNAETANKVKALGINAKDEEGARKALLKILNDNGIEGMEDEDTSTLIEIAESFVDESSASSGSAEDALAAEVDAEDNGGDDAEDDEDNDDEADDDDAESDEFAEMDRTALKAYIKENGLEISVKKSWSDDDIRDRIREALAGNGAEETEETAAPAEEKKAPAKSEKKSAPAKEKKAATKASAPEKKIGKRGIKIDPKNNEADREVFDCLHSLFPTSEYNYAWVASAGVTIKHIGKNSQRAMVLIENCSRQADDSIKCNLYLLTFNKQKEVLDEAGIEYEECWSGAPFIKGLKLTEAVEMIESLKEHITATVQKIDKKLGENRAKMEETLAKKAAPAKKAAKKSSK